MSDYRMLPVIIPSYEPDEKLPALLDKLKEKGFLHVILVDDGSGERYRQFFIRAEQQFGCTVLRHAVNLGKGRALKTAFNYCLQAFPEAAGCVTADSDGQHTPDCIAACAVRLLEQPEALVLGCRDFNMEGVPARSEWGNKCTCLVFHYLAGLKISDTQTGLRAIPRDFMKRLMEVPGERFEFETNMLLETKECGVPIAEVPIRTIYLEENKSSHFHPLRDSLRIYRVFGKFLFSALSSSVLDLTLFGVFSHLMKGKLPAQISYIVAATVLARLLSAVYNFTLNHRVVFQSGEKTWKSALRYAALAAVQMSCSAFLVDSLYRMTGGSEVLVKIPVDVLLFFLSFLIQREFVYRRGEQTVA